MFFVEIVTRAIKIPIKEIKNPLTFIKLFCIIGVVVYTVYTTITENTIVTV